MSNTNHVGRALFSQMEEKESLHAKFEFMERLQARKERSREPAVTEYSDSA